MSYIGQQLPADVFSGFTTDTFTGNNSDTTFTLSKAPFSEDGLIVVINNVIQQPTVNFTVSGTTLTIVGTAVATGDVIYAIHTSGAVPSTLASKVDVNGLSDGVILDADADTTISADTDDQIDFKAGGTDIMSLTATTATFNDGVTINVTDNSDALTLTSTDADANEGPVIVFDRNSSSSADADFIGALSYRGRNDADQGVDYCKIYAQIDDASDGTEDSQLFIKTFTNGTSRNRMGVYASGTVFNDDSQDIDFRVESDSQPFMFNIQASHSGNSAGTIGFNSTNSDGNFIEAINPQSGVYAAKFVNSASSGNLYNLNLFFSAQAPDDNSNYFIAANDTAAGRFQVLADGDVRNHDGTYTTISSDERLKSNITDANSQWDDIKAIRFRNYKKKDDIKQYGEDNAKILLGVVAQEAESATPKLVQNRDPFPEEIKLNSVFGTLYEDGDIIPEGKKIGDIKEIKEQVKTFKDSILFWKCAKALQEAMAKIETLETKVKALEDA